MPTWREAYTEAYAVLTQGLRQKSFVKHVLFCWGYAAVKITPASVFYPYKISTTHQKRCTGKPQHRTEIKKHSELMPTIREAYAEPMPAVFFSQSLRGVYACYSGELTQL